jgi:hypothetical protein
MASQRQIEIVAYRMWLERGCPEGSPDVDWKQAVHLLSGPAFMKRVRHASQERSGGLRLVNAGSRWNRMAMEPASHAEAPQTA